MRRGTDNQPTLLKLLNERAVWNYPPWRKPEWNKRDLERIRESAKVHGQANPTDPYAAERMLMHLLRELDDATAVNVAATRAIIARRRHNETQ